MIGLIEPIAWKFILGTRFSTNHSAVFPPCTSNHEIFAKRQSERQWLTLAKKGCSPFGLEFRVQGSESKRVDGHRGACGVGFRV